MENMITPFSISTQNRQHRAFNKAYAKTRHHIENAFALLVQKWRFLLRHLYYLDVTRMALTIVTCCALHNFCLDNDDNAASIPEETIREFEAEVRNFDHYADENRNDNIEVTVDNVEQQTVDGNVEVGETLRSQYGHSMNEIQEAHTRSQERGRQLREQMANSLPALTGTRARRYRREVLQQRRQQALQRLADNRARERSQRQRRFSRRNN
jgi:hypothetical protein